MAASTSSIRVIGAVIHRASHGFHLSSPLKPSNASLVLHRIGFFERGFSSPNSMGMMGSAERVRRIWTTHTVCMGRRSSKIATRKNAQDAKKAKRYGRIGKEIVSAEGLLLVHEPEEPVTVSSAAETKSRVKKGGPNPISNMVLAAVLEKAKELDVPKDILERNIKRASEKDQEAYIEKVYEVYGFGGVAIVVEVLTDKITRSVATIREVVKDYSARMADPGSVLFKFRRARVVNVKVTDVDKDQLLIVALDAGAEDVIEPSFDEDESEDRSERYYKIVSSTENYSLILSKLRDEGINFEPDNGSELLPLNPIEVDDEAMDLNKELMSKLLELDDVDAVYSDQK
ncbi:putative transcriptional regulatory protein [Acorus calamus]|uniref:Transcriptional regulatory protein n=1 Tax=Acorus calamus TaxID=4465 RepID=A0AAV9EFG0_ACOCL|nr:putative transcriptional regulatory protein [Acorus calamus]